MAALFEQDANAVLDYTIDWTAPLNGDTLASSTWVTSSDLTTASASNTTLLTTIYLSGGTPGKLYKVRNHITTANGRADEETFDLVIRDH